MGVGEREGDFATGRLGDGFWFPSWESLSREALAEREVRGGFFKVQSEVEIGRKESDW